MTLQRKNKEVWQFLGSLLGLILTAVVFNRFLDWHEHRPGWTFNDPVFTCFKSVDLSELTFIVLYSSILLFIVINRLRLEILTGLAVAYTTVLWLRLLMLFCLPFYADSDATKLEDPFLNTFIYPGNYVARDLFFSGHVAILVLLVLYSEKMWQRWLFLVSTIIVGVTVVLQKVHFSIDVVAAPFFSIIAFGIANRIRNRFFYKEK